MDKIQRYYNGLLQIKRPYLLGILGYIIFLPLLLLPLHSLSQNRTLKQPSPTSTQPSESPFHNPTFPPENPYGANHKILTLVQASPQNGGRGISPINIAISLTFDQPVQIKDVPFAVAPDFPYTIDTKGNVFTIMPKTTLQTGTTYSFFLRLYKPGGSVNLVTYSFTTSGPTSTPAPTKGPDINIDEYNKQLLQSTPDVYVANQTPYETNTFSVTATLNSDHYIFTVTAKEEKSTAQSDFISWLKSIGLNDKQINTLQYSTK